VASLEERLAQFLISQKMDQQSLAPSTGYETLWDPGGGGGRPLPVVNPPPKTSQYMEPGLSTPAFDPTIDFFGTGFGKVLGKVTSEAIAGISAAKGAGLFGATAYHGSPHLWPAEPGFPLGRFKASQVNTGEGAQAFGHAPGGYWAENPAVAKEYAQNLNPQRADVYRKLSKEQLTKLTDDYLEMFGREPAPMDLVREIDNAARGKTKFSNSLKEAGVEIKALSGTYLYKGDIPDEAIGKMLDWDKPLSQQQSQQIVSALKNVTPVNAGHGKYGLAIVGENGVGRQLSGISGSSPEEALFIVRTVLEELRVVGPPLLEQLVPPRILVRRVGVHD